MNHYSWRKNFTATISNQNKTIRGKLAFKTKETHWLHTEAPVVVPISIHSAIHEGISGDLKMNALISIIRSHVKCTPTILLTDKAHIQTYSLKCQNNMENAFNECLEAAHRLADRYQPYFEACNVVFWHTYICEDKNYLFCREQVHHLFQTDPVFQHLVHEDAERTYTAERAQEFPCRKLFIERSIADILEQCVCLSVIVKQGYRFWFYPGKSFKSTEYMNEVLTPTDRRLSWIDVFLSIEKKTTMYSFKSTSC